MAKLFAYGTLKDIDTQQTIFGRILKGEHDVLKGFTVSEIKIEEEFGIAKYPILEESENPTDVVSGMLFEITEEDIHLADTYEGLHYRRIEVKLESGEVAWAYIVTN
ncbi:gamma-glutamylcyclotransferase family protein [Flavobacterium sp. NG2]|uniref:gamma-glutamylcyclotransferase family protein n=1 Tax=Flavobacterium sp. NG2 TaxID=3097547 RepID=UPI002A80EF9B|nr:gamma-glutamylcyclotransferase family protein [Flavobacterium sp. NG2]WPR70260.1 gamma-glutamylcyclotransferase family protein [Flavobacterium sp. NG2]